MKTAKEVLVDYRIQYKADNIHDLSVNEIVEATEEYASLMVSEKDKRISELEFALTNIKTYLEALNETETLVYRLAVSSLSGKENSNE